MKLKLIEEKRPQRANRAQKVEMSTCFKLNEANIQRDGEWTKNKKPKKNKVTFCILKPSKYEEYFINVWNGDQNNNKKHWLEQLNGEYERQNHLNRHAFCWQQCMECAISNEMPSESVKWHSMFLPFATFASPHTLFVMLLFFHSSFYFGRNSRIRFNYVCICACIREIWAIVCLAGQNVEGCLFHSFSTYEIRHKYVKNQQITKTVGKSQSHLSLINRSFFLLLLLLNCCLHGWEMRKTFKMLKSFGLVFEQRRPKKSDSGFLRKSWTFCVFGFRVFSFQQKNVRKVKAIRTHRKWLEFDKHTHRFSIVKCHSVCSVSWIFALIIMF